jgi:hypothetical protein
MRSLALVALAGCSLATTGAPARYDARVAPDCTTSSALPVLDASATILAGVIGVPLLLTEGGCDGDGDCHDDGPNVARSFGALFVVTGAIYALSAYVGFSNVSSCKAATARHQRAPNSVAP